MTLIADAAVVGLVVGLVQIAKMTGLPGKFAPLLSLGLGVAYAIAMAETTIVAAVVQGITIGLAASGLFSGTKAMTAPQGAPVTFDSLPDEEIKA